MLPDFLAGVAVEFAAVPAQLDGATARGVLWQGGAGRLLLDFPDVGRFLVADGARLTIDPAAAVAPEQLRRVAQMAPLAALCYQRGMLALHGAAAVGPRGAIVIGGDSGAGKSTLLAALLQRGWRLLADDLTVVAADERGVPLAYPLAPELALWPDVRTGAGAEGHSAGRQYLQVGAAHVATPQPLRALFRLLVHKGELELCPLAGTQFFAALTTLSYNSRMADALLSRAAFLRQAAALNGTLVGFTLRRPRGCWSVEELADLLEGACP